MTGSRERHGPYPVSALENATLRLVLVPALGGKVVSLLDRRTGLEWLTQGEAPADAGSIGAFDARISYGWDECLPSIAPGPDPVEPGGALRDHGDFWGRPARTERHGESLVTTAEGLRWPYSFRRSLHLERSTVVAEYELETRGATLPFLWSMHPLFDPPPGSRIRLGRPDEVLVTGSVGLDLPPAPFAVSWPEVEDRAGTRIDLAAIRGVDARRAIKLGARLARPGRAAIERADGRWIGIEWDRDVMPLLGIWLGEGAWPSVAAPVFQVGLEPTNASSDGLGEAIRRGEARFVAPGSPLRWDVRLSAGEDATSLGRFLQGL